MSYIASIVISFIVRAAYEGLTQCGIYLLNRYEGTFVAYYV